MALSSSSFARVWVRERFGGLSRPSPKRTHSSHTSPRNAWNVCGMPFHCAMLLPPHDMEGTEEGGDRTDTRDPLRDTWMRYLGYANEVGEACRGLLPLTFVHATYGLVGLYVLADAAHKGHRASHVPTSPLPLLQNDARPDARVMRVMCVMGYTRATHRGSTVRWRSAGST